jgi:hypothetical protein
MKLRKPTGIPGRGGLVHRDASKPSRCGPGPGRAASKEALAGRARDARRAAAVAVSAAAQACRWPSTVHQNRWPLVHTVTVAVTEMTATFSAAVL